MIRWLKSFFAWKEHHAAGAWVYLENAITGQRKAFNRGGFSPLDYEFMRDGDFVVSPRGNYVIGSASEMWHR
jgi:hypothetical protein